MNTKRVNVSLIGVILDESTELTLDDLCRSCRVEQSEVVALVEEGIIEPMTRGRLPWRFSGAMLPLVVRAIRLQRDFELNPAGVAFALDLLDELAVLRSRLNIIEGKTERR
ncbi:MAG: chaperone modulator CbpM [Gammaproteobacteria bacterium]